MNSILEVVRKEGEQTMSVVRRFVQKVRRSGIVREVRGARFRTRPPSKLTRKHDALRRIERSQKLQNLRKWGKA